MEILAREQRSRFLEALKEYREAFPAGKDLKRKRLVSQVDLLANDEEGLQILYDCMPEFLTTDFFAGSVWENPRRLVPTLVRGTLLAGYPTNVYELLSELRMAAIYEKKVVGQGVSSSWAENFLKEVIVHNFDIAYAEIKQPNWEKYSDWELKKLRLLFDFLVEKIPVHSLKENLLKEIETSVAHRPIVTSRMEMIIDTVHLQFELSESDPIDSRLIYYNNVLHRFSVDKLIEQMPKWGKRKIKTEARLAGENMKTTGLVAHYQLQLLKFIARAYPELIPEALALNLHGIAEFERFRDLVVNMIEAYIVPANKQAVVGLGRVLERNLLSKKPVRHALNRLMSVSIHPHVARHLELGKAGDEPATPRQLLIGGVLNLLGQPLGVRQGNNPTCQSARALSMWSRHAPAKLINLMVDAASSNNVIFRYSNQLIESNKMGNEVGKNFDFNLDYASIVLVPHLDNIYAEMMKMASWSHPIQDPHVSVNPAFYGHWIQTGFLSVYNQVTARIENYDDFVATFYASFHPDFNGGHPLVYPVPLGIFITDASAVMHGFHAISLTRVTKSPKGEWRAYFFNPNSEGPQNWGQEIRPSVHDNGELYGESSLPFFQLVSRIYAFHFNQLQLGDKAEKVPAATVRRVRKLAQESWGVKYKWA